MAIEYRILAHDEDTHIVTIRWQDGESYRDEAFDLEMVVPGAKITFDQMSLPFNFEAALSYLERRCSGIIESGKAVVKPPLWSSTVPYQQIVETTPEGDRPAPPTAEPD